MRVSRLLRSESIHVTEWTGEKARIIAAGGFVDFGRVNGNLALSRALGDFEFKKSADLPPEAQIVTAYPDVTIHELADDDEFMVVACDGTWLMHSPHANTLIRNGQAYGIASRRRRLSSLSGAGSQRSRNSPSSAKT